MDREDCIASLKKMKENVVFYKNILTENSQTSILKIIFDYSFEELTNKIKEKFNTDSLDQATYIKLRMYCYGYVRILKEWLFDEIDLSVEDFVDIYFATSPIFLL